MRKYFSAPISENLSRTSEGYLICHDVPIGRTGWLVYNRDDLLPDGMDTAHDSAVVEALAAMDAGELMKVNRSDTALFDPDTIASFEGKAVTELHPPELVTCENDSIYRKGHLSNVRRGPRLPTGEDSLVADLIITDPALASRVESKELREVSQGYNYKLRKREDGKYEQHDIRGNHLAIVPEGRAGRHVRINDHAPTKETVSMASFGTSMLKALGMRALAKDAAVSDADFHRGFLAAQDADEDDDDNKKKDKEKEGEDKKGKDAAPLTAADVTRIVMDAIAADRKARDDKDDDDNEKKKKSDDEKDDDDDDDEDEDEKKKEKKADDEGPIDPDDEDDKKKKKAHDAAGQLVNLKKTRKAVAQSGNRAAMDAYNAAYWQLKGGVALDEASYDALLKLEKPEAVRSAYDHAGQQDIAKRNAEYAAACEARRTGK